MKSVTGKIDPRIELIQVTGIDQLDEIRRLFIEYAQSLDIDLCFQDFDQELETLPGKYAPPMGALILAMVDGQPAGCIALRQLTDNICEMKRLFVRPDFRGLKIGSQLIAKIIKEAKDRQYKHMRLDTLSTMKNALKLYSSFGFYEIEPYIFNPIQGARYLELKLI